MSRWEAAFDNATTDPSVKEGFPDTTDERFFIRIKDPDANNDPEAVETITVSLTSRFFVGIEPDTDFIDEIVAIETGPNTGVFQPRNRIIVVSDPVDDQVFDQNPATSDPDGDETITCLPSPAGNGFLELSYKGTSARRLAEDPAKSHLGVFAIKLRVWIVRDMIGGGLPVTKEQVYGDILTLNSAFAQANLQFRDTRLRPLVTADIRIVNPPRAEPFQDFGMDGRPNTGDPGEGDGIFNDTHADANFFHDVGEDEREPFTDVNRNGSYDYAVDASDGIDIYNGLLSREGKSPIDSLGDGDETTIDVFYVRELPRRPALFQTGSDAGLGILFIGRKSGAAFGISLNSADHPVVRRNSAVISRLRRPFTLAHEVAHVLINQPGHDDEATNLLFEFSSVEHTRESAKRLKKGQTVKVRSSAPTLLNFTD